MTFAAAVVMVLQSAALAGEVPLRIDVTAPPLDWPVPCTVGVPFPKGVLSKNAPVAVRDADGALVPCQTRVTATWNADGSQGVRWLLLDFQPKDARPHRLVFGTEAKAAETHGAIVTEKDGAFVIDTGALRTTCPTNQLDPWTALERDGRKWLDVTKPMGPLVTHETRGTFLAINDKAARVTLEENGPWRATLKATGWYVDGKGGRFGRYLVRLHFYRNRPDVRMEHTFIFTGETLTDRVRDLAIAMPLAMNKGNMRGALAGEEHVKESTMYDFSSAVHWSLASDRADGRTLEWKLRDLRAGKNYYRGEKNAGWVFARTDAPAGVAMVLRDAWQQSPFELEVEDNVVRLHLWPLHGRLMDLSFDGIWRHLTEEQKIEKLEAKPVKAGQTVQDTLKWVRSVNRSGIAKTHDLWLLFRCEDVYTLRDRARSVVEPVLAVVDPAWACATEALMQPAHPYDQENFRDEEAFLSSILTLRQAERERGLIYGFFEFGAYHQRPFSDGDRNLDGGPWRRARPKAHYGWSTYAPAMYYRTGDRRYLKYAQEYTHYSADAGFCFHDNPATKDFEGGEFGYNNSEIHWMGGAEVTALQGREDAVYLYWMTGERRMLDAALMWAEQSERYEETQVANGGGFFKSLEREGPYGNTRRNLGLLLQRWSILYAATWDVRWKERADRIAETFRQIDFSRDKPEEVQNYLQFHASWVLEGLDFYHQLTGDPRIREVLLDFCRQAMRRGLGFSSGGRESGSLNFYSYGYLLTQDPAFLRVGQNAVTRALADWACPEALSPGGKWTVQTLPRFLGVTMKAPPEFRARTLPSHARGLIVQWPADHHACFLEGKDGPISIQFASLAGGSYALFDPDGRVCARTELSYATSLSGKLETPADGKTGVYTLQHQTPEKGLHYIISHSFDKVVYELPRPGTLWMPIARSFVVQQKAGQPASLTLRRPAGDWASDRPDRLVELGGSRQVMEINRLWPSSQMLNLALPARTSDTLWRYELGMREGHISTVVNAQGQETLVPSGLGRYFAGTANDFFEPSWRAGPGPPFQVTDKK